MSSFLTLEKKTFLKEIEAKNGKKLLKKVFNLIQNYKYITTKVASNF